MNYKIVLNVLGKALILMAGIMLIPMCVGLLYKEYQVQWFLIPIAIMILVGIAFNVFRAKNRNIRAKEGFFIVAFMWIFFCLAGCLPFILSGYIPNFFNAFFETVSGMTTTGSTILNDPSILPKGLQFWRLFLHWIGGMGVLVFVLAILPNNIGISYVYRTESPGPIVGKIVGKMRKTAQILYGIYILLTVLLMILFICGGMPVYDGVVYAFSIAGTGGFGITNAGLSAYNSVYIEMVAALFMVLFSTNFNVFYLLLVGSFSKAVKNEEMRWYFIMLLISTLVIALNILSSYGDFLNALRYSFFQVASISSTTGLATADFDTWPTLSKSIIIILMMIGACGGSTGGGIKVSRIIILFKSSIAEIKQLFHPHTVVKPTLEGEALDDTTVRNVKLYMLLWVVIVLVTFFILAFDSFGDVLTNLTATLTCIGNVGPGLQKVGPTLNFSGYSWLSKLTLSFTMLAGRLEIFPMLIFFTPKIWKTK